MIASLCSAALTGGLTQCFEMRGFIAAAFNLLCVSLSLVNIKAPKYYFSDESKPALFSTSSK